MARAPSDFEEGVLAAAKWLRNQEDSENAIYFLGWSRTASNMLAEVTGPDEGTEARTVAQIVQYLRERGYGDKGLAAVCDRLAANISVGDWKQR